MRRKPKFDPKAIGKMPEGYIPGIDRGDHGFMTRNDLGPMLSDAQTTINNARALAEQRQNRSRNKEDGTDSAILNDSRGDSWNGTEEPLFQKTADYDNEDEEADDVYRKIDE